VKEGQGEEIDENGARSITTWINGTRDGTGTY